MKQRLGLMWTLLAVAAVSYAGCSPLEGMPGPAPGAPSEAAPVEAADLENQTWRLTGYANAQGEPVEAAAQAPAIVTFQEGSVNGTSGCNSFFGTYTLDGDRISIGEMGSTLMACEEDLMRQEQDFLAALANAATYTVEGDTLQLYDAGGAMMASFVLQVEETPAATLTGVKWSATALGGAGAVSSLLAGTEISAIFRDDGRLEGNAGCNRYSAPYTVDGNTLAVGAVAVTRILCSAPQGIMQQEEQYLAALEAVTAYRIEGDTLDLLDANGDMVVSFAVQAAGTVESPSQAAAPSCAEPVLGGLAYEIRGVFDRPIRLEGCTYEDPAGKTSAKLLADHTGRGVIDGTPSIAAMLFVQPSETISQYYLALVQEADGRPVHVASYLLGGRVLVKSVAIEDDRIVLDMLTQAPGSASCCSFAHVRNVYEFRDGRIVQVSSVEVSSQ